MDKERIFEKLLPEGVQIGPEVRRDGGAHIGGAHLDNAIVSYLRTEPNQPLAKQSFVIGIQGRGTLNIPGTEFMSLLATMIALTKSIAGLTPPPEMVNPAGDVDEREKTDAITE